ncbi:MAG: right-handed parallel beta-helix repeat-containing protein [Candidatus Cloacimonetes bacterium]|nr:right-handed parallel beta-helix repeat-containing protein [Candidatus Cloacimonadota bacterium]
MKTKIFWLVTIILLFSSYAMGNIINVPDDQPTIQAGINTSVDGDTILVQPGTYVENINYNGKNIVVGSLFLITGDTTYISQTIIDGNQNWKVVKFNSGEDSTASLTGFTITNGGGGGIYCHYSSPKLENLIIRDNTGTWGVGIYCRNSSSILLNIMISDNTGFDDPAVGIYSCGGGIYIFDNSNPTLMNVTISRNYGYCGGGIYCENYSNPKLFNILISENITHYGGGICCSNSHPDMVNVTITGNSANFGGGIFCVNNSNPSLVNSILWNNSPQEIYFFQDYDPNSITIVYSDVQNGIDSIVTNDNGVVNWLEGNIDEDPMFVDTLNNNYQLQEGSPCIDAGTPDTVGLNLPPYDLAGNPRISGGRIDMGAYEWQYPNAVDDWQNQSTGNVLFQNYPNPFSNSTTISFNLYKLLSIPMMFRKEIYLEIFNVKGQLVRQLSIDYHSLYISESIEWDGKDKNGKELFDGVYLYRLQVDNYKSELKKMILIK